MQEIAENSGLFFASIAADHKSHTKISIQKALDMIYFWAKDFSNKNSKDLLNVYGWAEIEVS